eukprot:Platyproteum_vivax@DN13359_c0_g1_i1.p1
MKNENSTFNAREVSFNKIDVPNFLTLQIVFSVGCASVFHPLTVLQTVSELHESTKPPPKGNWSSRFLTSFARTLKIRDSISALTRQENVFLTRALYTGFPIQCTQSILFDLLQFLPYKYLKCRLEESTYLSPVAPAVAGGLTGMLFSPCVHPCSVIMRNQVHLRMHGSKQPSIGDAIKRIVSMYNPSVAAPSCASCRVPMAVASPVSFQSLDVFLSPMAVRDWMRGWLMKYRGLYRGVFFSIPVTSLGGALTWTTFEYFKKAIWYHTGSEHLWTIVVSGFCSGAITSIALRPAGVLMTEMQANEKYRGKRVWQIVLEICRNQGPGKLFSGVTARLLQSSLRISMFFSMYQLMGAWTEIK